MSLPRRRNGKQQACEPCRKGKMACDHTLPFCDRCKRRRIVSKCQYLPAPMTRTVRDTDDTPWELSPVSLASSPSVVPSVESVSSGPSVTGPFNKSTGFYGSTSFSAVFLENQRTFNADMRSLRCTSEPPQDKPVRPKITSEVSRHNTNSSLTSMGIKVLQQLPDQQTMDHLLKVAESYEEYNSHRPSVKYCIASMWSTFGNVLREPRRPEDLKVFAQRIFSNGEKALEPTATYSSWLASHCGENLRWEAIGIVFTILGMAVLSLQDRDPFFATQRGSRSNRKLFTTELRECAQSCLTLSGNMDLINPLMVALNLKLVVLETCLCGDSSLVAWRQNGDVAATATALGLHLDGVPTGQVTFESEFRKRIWLRTFGMDKCIAAFVGRPPVLSHRYAHSSMPLDLSEDELMLDDDDLKNAMAALDANGWNTKGNIYPVTIIRARYSFDLILAETLEISLGVVSADAIERMTNLRRRLEDAYASFPFMLQWSSVEALRPKENSSYWRQLNLRLSYLRNHFLLDRLSVKHGQPEAQTLLNVAREMLELSVLIWLERDRFVERHFDYDWMLMCYGIPSSGVLALELLKQLQAPHEEHPHLPRSEVVQNLSVLVRFLDWVPPTAGNYALCGRMQKMIKDILDQVLEPQTEKNLPPPEVFSNQVFQTDFSAFDNFENNMDWLDTMDWAKGQWIDLA